MNKQDIVRLADELNCSNVTIGKGTTVYFDHPRKCQIIATSPNTFKEQARKYYGANFAVLAGGMATFAYCVAKLSKLIK